MSAGWRGWGWRCRRCIRRIRTPNSSLLLDEGHCLADQALAVCGLDRRFLRVDLGATSLATLCRLVAADHGLTLLPEAAVAAELGAAPDFGGSPLRPALNLGRLLALVRRAGTDGAAWFPAPGVVAGGSGRAACCARPQSCHGLSRAQAASAWLAVLR